jgi:hypothetical protein
VQLTAAARHSYKLAGNGLCSCTGAPATLHPTCGQRFYFFVMPPVVRIFFLCGKRPWFLHVCTTHNMLLLLSVCLYILLQCIFIFGQVSFVMPMLVRIQDLQGAVHLHDQCAFGVD